MSAGDAAGSIRTLLVDDHPVVRYGVRHILDSEDDIEVVGELDGIGGSCARLRRNSRSSSTPRTTKRTTSSRRRNWEWTATC
jgi:DNA-binding NarL/FixJ family response regulator